MRIRGVYKNIFASALPQIANIIYNLILPSLLISTYGSEINGLTTTVKQIISYVSLVGSGIAVATTQSLYKPVAQKDVKTVNGMLCASNKMFNHYGTVYLLIVGVIALIYPLFLKESLSYFEMVLLLCIMSVSGASEFFVVGRCRSLLYAHRKVYICTTVQAVSIISSLVFAIVLVKAEANIITVQVAVSSVYIFRALVLYIYTRVTYPEYRYFYRDKPINKAVEKRNAAMLHQITGLISTGSQSIILSTMVGLQAVSVFAVYNVVFSGLQSIFSNIITAITPYFGKVVAEEDQDRLVKQFDFVECIFFAMITVVFSVAGVMILPFVSLYTQGADICYIDNSMAALFLTFTLFNIARLPGQAIINTKGHFKETKSRAVIEATLCVVLSIIFTLSYGRIGVLLGSAIAMGWRCFDIMIYANKRLMGRTCRKSLLRFGGAFINIILMFLVGEFVNIHVETWTDWIFVALVCSVVSIILTGTQTYFLNKNTVRPIVQRLASTKRE